jgi:hypothetical protein
LVGALIAAAPGDGATVSAVAGVSADTRLTPSSVLTVVFSISLISFPKDQFDFLPERVVLPFLFEDRGFYESCPPVNQRHELGGAGDRHFTRCSQEIAVNSDDPAVSD